MTRHCQVQIAQANDEADSITLTHQTNSEVQFWSRNVSILNVRHVFASRKVNKIVCCDASATGTGAIVCNDVHTAHKQWSKVQATKSSTWRELNTILFAISSFLPIVSGSQLKIYTDSQPAARIVEVGSMNTELQGIANDIFQICMHHNIRIEVEWIPRNKNEQADFVSRLVDTDDWMISTPFFHILTKLWGPFSVDCFACHYNTKLPRFFSRFWNPGTSGVDAFAQNWSGENCLLVPPVVLIPSVLQTLLNCKAKGTLVFPQWPSSVFWPIMWLHYKIWIKGFVSVKGENALELGRNKNSLLGSQRFKGVICAVFIDCTAT